MHFQTKTLPRIIDIFFYPAVVTNIFSHPKTEPSSKISSVQVKVCLQHSGQKQEKNCIICSVFHSLSFALIQDAHTAFKGKSQHTTECIIHCIQQAPILFKPEL